MKKHAKTEKLSSRLAFGRGCDIMLLRFRGQASQRFPFSALVSKKFKR